MTDYFNQRIIDMHTHIAASEESPSDWLSDLSDYLSFTGVQSLNILTIKHGIGAASLDALALLAKISFSGRVRAFDGIWMGNPLYPFTEQGIYDQVCRSVGLGFDGIKLHFVLSDPTVPGGGDPLRADYISDSRMDGAFDYLERNQIPILLHNGLPPRRVLPRGPMSREENEKFRTVQLPFNDGNVTIQKHLRKRLERNPNLRLILAHMNFMAASLPELQELLDSYPNLRVDVCPANGVYYEMSRDPQAIKEFFLRNQNRVYFGTDQFVPGLGGAQQIMNIRRFLETEQRFFAQLNNGISSGFWGHEVQGIGLPDQVTDRIYFSNWERDYPEESIPAPEALAELCRAELAGLQTIPGTETEIKRIKDILEYLQNS